MKFVKNTFIQFNYFTSALKSYLFLKKTYRYVLLCFYRAELYLDLSLGKLWLVPKSG